MTPAQRRALLGDAVIARIHAEVAAAPPPPPEVLEVLRRIFASIQLEQHGVVEERVSDGGVLPHA